MFCLFRSVSLHVTSPNTANKMNKSYYDPCAATLLPLAETGDNSFTFIKSTETSSSLYITYVFAPSRLPGKEPRKNFLPIAIGIIQYTKKSWTAPPKTFTFKKCREKWGRCRYHICKEHLLTFKNRH